MVRVFRLKALCDSACDEASIRRPPVMQLPGSRLDYERLFTSANPPGAATPANARDSLTRHAIRRKETRRRALRAGNAGFVRAMLGGAV